MGGNQVACVQNWHVRVAFNELHHSWSAAEALGDQRKQREQEGETTNGETFH